MQQTTSRSKRIRWRGAANADGALVVTRDGREVELRLDVDDKSGRQRALQPTSRTFEVPPVGSIGVATLSLTSRLVLASNSYDSVIAGA